MVDVVVRCLPDVQPLSSPSSLSSCCAPQELANLKVSQSTITTQWQSEKAQMARLGDLKEEIERVNMEIQQAERDYDLNRCGARQDVDPGPHHMR